MTTLREFQNETANFLKEGKSTLIHAPTGLGKTWATANGFAQRLDKRGLLGTRLLHVLPMRALATSVKEDVAGLLKDLYGRTDIEPAIHHGQRPESEIYAERVCVTTIDQYFAAFAGAPLSFAGKSGHAVAGAIIGSYSVFDEVHLLEPERGLPLLYAVLKQRQRWGLLSAVMTATLPSSVRKFLRDDVGLEIIKPSAQDVQVRDGWREVTLRLEDKLNQEGVATRILEAQREQKRVIAFVNTVDASIDLYNELKGKTPQGCQLLVIHSNFAPLHRQEREKALLETFGRGSQQEAILITTQVAEAGLNISAPLVFSELASVDSLIQRAGRCTRFKSGGNTTLGTFIVYPPQRENAHLPYHEDLVKRTNVALDNRRNVFGLDWQAECELVDEVLNSYYSHFIRTERVNQKDAKIKKTKGEGTELPRPQPKSKAISVNDALGIFDQAFLQRDPRDLERTLRNINNVQVVVADRPSNAGGAMFDNESFSDSFQEYLRRQNRLKHGERDLIEGIPVSFGRFERKVREKEFDVWEVVMQREEKSAPTFDLAPTHRIMPNRTYVIASESAGYTASLGLSFELASETSETPRLPPLQHHRDSYQHHFQTWLEHCQQVYYNADKMIGEYMPFIRAAAKAIPSTEENFADSVASLMRVAALFHDIGKLNMPWQRAIRGGTWDGQGKFWGKSQDEGIRGLPPHAFYVLPVLRYLFCELGVINDAGKVDRLAELMALASARHHSLGSLEGNLGWTAFEFHPERGRTITAVKELLENALGGEAHLFQHIDLGEMLEHVNNSDVYNQSAEHFTFSHTLDTPSPSEDYYPFYVLASRIVKVADWEASGSRRVELWH